MSSRSLVPSVLQAPEMRVGHVATDVVILKKFILHWVPAAVAPSTLNRAKGNSTDDSQVPAASSSVVVATRPSATGSGRKIVSKGAPVVLLVDGLYMNA